MDALLPLRASCHYGRSQSFNGAGVSSKLSCRCRLARTRRFCSNAVYALSDSGRDKGGGQRQQTPPARPSSLHEHRQEHRKPFRFKARWRLALRRLRRLSPSFLLHCFVLYFRTHSKQVALSAVLGCTLALGCLGLKFSTVHTPLFVPYSMLVNHLQANSVMSVLFEEGSRQVYFDLKPVEGEAESAQSSVLEVVAPASFNAPQADRVGSVVDAHFEKLKTTIPLDEVALKQLQTESSALKAVMDEDIVKHWIGQGAMKVTGPQSLLPGIRDREGDVDVLREDKRSLETGKQSLVPSTDDPIVNNDRSSIISSALKPASSFLLKATEHASEQLLQTQSHPWKYATRRIDNDEAFLLGLMREKGVTYSSSPQPMSVALRTTLITIFSLWIPLTPLFWLMYRQFLGGNSTSQKKRSRSPTAKFDDVAGVDEAKSELIEIVSYLQGALNFRTLGAKLPKGILLVGPPGTGKTLLARAMAGEAGVPFFATSASEFVEMFVGRGAARIRNLFTTARKQAPSIIFIDELDAVGGRRGRSFNDERDQTLNQLLTEMDGFESETGVLVIAATNRPEALDPALCRPGRFSRKVFVREPDQRGREQILAVHMRGVPIEGEVDFVISVVASITRGFVGADLANVVNEAALLAVREGRSMVTLEDLKTAVVRVKFGVGNKPALYGALGRVADWLQPKAPKTLPPGYEAPSWSG